MVAKPIKTLELHYLMIQFLIIIIIIIIIVIIIVIIIIRMLLIAAINLSGLLNLVTY